MFSIDGKQRSELPEFLKSVPTLYVPETKDVFKGQAIYSYISKPVAARREIPTSQGAPQAAAGGAAPAAGGVGDFTAWSFGGSSGFTESYSDWNAPSKFAEDQLHYTFLGGATATPAPPEPTTQSQSKTDNSPKNGDVASRMEALQKQRDSEFNGIARK